MAGSKRQLLTVVEFSTQKLVFRKTWSSAFFTANFQRSEMRCDELQTDRESEREGESVACKSL